jgi:hypothetical protein
VPAETYLGNSIIFEKENMMESFSIKNICIFLNPML